MGTAFGLLGTVLASISTWRSMRLDRAVLRVSVEPLVDPVGKQRYLQFSVVNIGRIPATLRSVGFTLRGTSNVYRFSPSQNTSLLPRLIQPGEIVSCTIPHFVFGEPSWLLAKHPFFEVAGGRIAKGKRIPKGILYAPLGYPLERPK